MKLPLFESLSKDKQDIICRHLEQVIEANEKVNLTRIDTVEEGMMLHVEDSLTALEELNEAPVGMFADLGSGGGFPGIPLAVASERMAVLIDARKKKMDVMQGIVSQLKLESRVSIYAGRAELFARTQSKRFEALTARALAKLPVLMELGSPLLKQGGRLICYKAQVEEPELAHARRVQAVTGMEMVGDREFVLGETYKRRIITFEKTGNPTVKLPRAEGAAQRDPLDV